ncbi:hypothetical protein [Streptomyces sp. 1331.2]|uniref:hypothetical protein n=1 Tax=Streptomyces sp. 1331.2 TaxID=1938835 RepID=UPI0015CF80D5|nr:hypothetical protein [Streptomyces sp. 1331.2]
MLLHVMNPDWARRWRAELVERLGPDGDFGLVPDLPLAPSVLDDSEALRAGPAG